VPKQYWLVKSEPGSYSIDDLARDGKTRWDGVRNYQARNLLRDGMKPGDSVLFYHSSTDPAGVVGIARVASPGYPDPSAFDRKSKYFDPDSDPKKPAWFVVDVEFVEKLPRIVTLAELKANDTLEGMLVLKRGMRLSVQPVDKAHFDAVVKMARRRK
jgi:predicted RNA-binding protein with PUA-like domain